MSETESKDNGESRNNESRPEPRQRQQRTAQRRPATTIRRSAAGIAATRNGEQRAAERRQQRRQRRQQRHEGGGAATAASVRSAASAIITSKRRQRSSRTTRPTRPAKGPRSGIVIDLNELKRKPPTAAARAGRRPRHPGRRRPRAQAGRHLPDPEGACPRRRRHLRRRRARNPAGRLRLPARSGRILSGRSRRHLHLAVADPPLQPAHRRLHHRPHPPAEGRRALLRAAQGRQHQRRAARGVEEQDPVREPHAAVPAQDVPSGARQRFERRHHRPHHGSDRAGRQRPARPDRVAAESRQDDDAAERRPGDRAQPSGCAPDHPADRRASRGSHRDAAQRARRSDLARRSTNRPCATCRSPRW